MLRTRFTAQAIDDVLAGTFPGQRSTGVDPGHRPARASHHIGFRRGTARHRYDVPSVRRDRCITSNAFGALFAMARVPDRRRESRTAAPPAILGARAARGAGSVAMIASPNGSSASIR